MLFRSRHFNQLTSGISATLLGVGAARPLKWSHFPITFDSGDNPKSLLTVGRVPLVCSPTISNVVVTKTLIDGGAGLSVIYLKTFNKMQLPYEQLIPRGPSRA